MANPPPPSHDGIADDFFEQIFAMPGYAGGDAAMPVADGTTLAGGMSLQLSSGEGPSAPSGGGGGVGAFREPVFPLGLSLERGRGGYLAAAAEDAGTGKRLREEAEGKAPANVESDPVQLASLFPAYGHVHSNQLRPSPPSPQVFHGQVGHSAAGTPPQPPAPRPRVRARRGQATDPHSIAERLRRERIAERMRALQELLPNSNKTDRAAMLDEILDYVKFLRLQVKVLSMSRLGGAGAVAQLVADIPLSSSVEGDTSESGSKQQIWDKWSTDGTERQVAELMEKDIGAAMQFLQSKALCIMPISLATAIYHSHHQPEASSAAKPEPNTPS